jgi:murein DD-endopeptidase MepM/ murein hydrolase activator NlpD
MVQSPFVSPAHSQVLYGLPTDPYRIEKGKVGRDQNLGQILNQYVLPEGALTQMLLYGTQSFDFRKIRHGNAYAAFVSKNSDDSLRYLVYEHSPLEFVIFDFADSLRIRVCEREVLTRRQQAHGDITTSLWDAITKDSVNPQVALRLSEIFAWTVDFFGLQPGDHFKVVYDELYVDSVSVGIGRIHAASFFHAGKEIVAIPFIQDSVEAYFDAEGNSLRRAFLKAPVRFSRISSRFSGSRLHPILKIHRPHFGVDYAAPYGTPVYAIGDGRVLSVGYQGGAGRMVKIRHNSVYTSSYMHLSSFGKGIRGGQYVKQGDLIGYVGSSGLSSGPHLDFRVFRNGSPIDPLKMESPPVDPVKPQNMMDFQQVRVAVLQLLSGEEENQMADDFIPAALLYKPWQDMLK